MSIRKMGQSAGEDIIFSDTLSLVHLTEADCLTLFSCLNMIQSNSDDDTKMLGALQEKLAGGVASKRMAKELRAAASKMQEQEK